VIEEPSGRSCRIQRASICWSTAWWTWWWRAACGHLHPHYRPAARLAAAGQQPAALAHGGQRTSGHGRCTIRSRAADQELHPKIIDLSLDRVWRLMEKIGHPEQRLPPVVHVAGTNGKGSVIAYLRAMLEAAGKRVHVYTSPHLVRFHERIRLNGTLISESDLLQLLEECEAANGGTPITFFEITTCAAFLAFARMPADILLMEVGLGGRLDATNVIDRPLLTVQMPISFDHMQFLPHPGRHRQ
jgi:dihydrofolate synthase/folylpolyglutamate synthase